MSKTEENVDRTSLRGKDWQAVGAFNVLTPPFGYCVTLEPVPLNPNPDTILHLRDAFRLYATGVHSTSTIASILRDQGVCGVSGKPLGRDALREAFLNPVYLGLMRVGAMLKGKKTPRSSRPVLQANHPAVISPALFNMAQMSRKLGHKHKWALAKVQKRVILCQRRTVCAYCGRLMMLEAKPSRGLATEFYILGQDDSDCPECVRRNWSWGKKPSFSLDNPNYVQFTRFVRQVIETWAEQRLDVVNELWEKETQSVMEVARRESEVVTFHITTLDLVAEAALASIYTPWDEATPQAKRDMAHVVLKTVPMDPVSGVIDIPEIVWNEPFNTDKFTQVAIESS